MWNRPGWSAHVRRVSFSCAAVLTVAALAAAGTAGAALPAKVVNRCPGARALPGERPAPVLGKATVCLVNGMRTSRGLRALRMNRQLNTFATSFSRRMVREQFFAHDVPNGPDFQARARASAYAKTSRRMTMGENLAWGSSELATPAAIVDAWMRSPGHRVNMLRRDFRDIGLGVVLGAPQEGDVGGVAITYVHAFGARVTR